MAIIPIREGELSYRSSKICISTNDLCSKRVPEIGQAWARQKPPSVDAKCDPEKYPDLQQLKAPIYLCGFFHRLYYERLALIKAIRIRVAQSRALSLHAIVDRCHIARHSANLFEGSKNSKSLTFAKSIGR